MKTELIKQLTRNETEGGIFTPVKLASRSQLLAQQNTHNYFGAGKDSNLKSLVSVSDSLIAVQGGHLRTRDSMITKGHFIFF